MCCGFWRQTSEQSSVSVWISALLLIPLKTFPLWTWFSNQDGGSGGRRDQQCREMRWALTSSSHKNILGAMMLAEGGAPKAQRPNGRPVSQGMTICGSMCPDQGADGLGYLSPWSSLAVEWTGRHSKWPSARIRHGLQRHEAVDDTNGLLGQADHATPAGQWTFKAK